MSKSTAQIQGTNDYSSVSKYSMVKAGYFEDEFIQYFVRKYCRRTPLINIGYYVRARIIDFLFQTFLNHIGSRRAQVISCGAGYDTSFFRLLKKGVLHENIMYYEVDFPELVQKKHNTIKETSDLASCVGNLIFIKQLGEAVIFQYENYRLIGCDLINLKILQQCLQETNIDLSLPTLLFSECAITYMDEFRSSALIQWASSQFENSMFATYEQVFPNDGFGIIMTQHFMTLKTPLLSLKDFSTLECQQKRYLTQGFTSCVSKSAWDLFTHITDVSERSRIFNLELFDEFEELHLKCCHYSLTTAFQGTLIDLENIINIILQSSSLHNIVQQKLSKTWTLDTLNNDKFFRYSHDSCVTSDILLTVGGFGISSSGKHERLKSILLYHSNGDVLLSLDNNHCVPPTLDCVYHTCTYVPNSNKIVLFGGRTSPHKPVNNIPTILSPTSTLSVNSCFKSVNSNCVIPPRWRHTAVYVKMLTGQNFEEKIMSTDCVLIFGGRTKELKVLDDLWMLNICEEGCNTHEINTVPEQVWPSPRLSHSAASYGSHEMVVTGGLGGYLQPLNDVWCFNCTVNSWRQLDVIMLPRYGHKSVISGSQLLLIGGINTLAGKQPGICIINMVSSECMEYALPVQDPEKPILLHNHSAEIFPDNNTVTVIGGGGNCFSFGTAFNKSIIKFKLNDLLQKT